MTGRVAILLGVLALVGTAVAWFGALGPAGGTRGGSGAPLALVSAPAHLSPIARQGEALFASACGGCHGLLAEGRDGYGPPLVHALYAPEVFTDVAIQVALRMGVRAHNWDFGNMPQIQGLTLRDEAAIVNYIREMQQANGIF